MKKVLKSTEDGSQDFVMFEDLFDWCNYLSSLNGVTDDTVASLCRFLNRMDKDDMDICVSMLSKTLRLGVTASSVNKVIPNLIPVWEVQQAFPIEKYPVKDGTEFWLTEKYNGVRATLYNGKLISRTGAPYCGLDHIIKAVRFVSLAGFVLDGELTLKNKEKMTDNEAFRVATGIINAENGDKTAICYTVFDIIPITEFDDKSAENKLTYSQRREILSVFSDHIDSEFVSVAPVLYHGNDISQIDGLLDHMVTLDKEGLMLNLDVPYKRSRHRGILKIKRFYTMDLRIVGVREGTGKLKGTLGAIEVDYKGNIVRVGSGLTDSERSIFWEKRELLEGLLCEVKYKEISYDKNTSMESLQFPVFVRLRADKHSVSFG